MASQSYEYGDNGMFNVFKSNKHSAHPDFANLTLLVFEAVMEVVCVSAPGYIVARMGQFDAESQKFLANLNTQLFTPCLSKSLPPITMTLVCVSHTFIDYVHEVLLELYISNAEPAEYL